MSTPELHAPDAWRSLDFISDLHLQAAQPATFEAWRRFMVACDADALFILGDLFEAWVGDDAAGEPGFEDDCAEVLRATARRLPVFFLHGNRDFLVGAGLMQSTGVTLLDDPTVLVFADRRWLLSHGDALCVDDADYQAFRRKVRDAGWQSQFLSQALEQRRAIARGLRTESEERASSGVEYADVDTATAVQWLQAARAETLIHGHTHAPREHQLGGGFRRIVLSDWDASAQPPRLEVLRLSAGGAERVNLG
ncbi:UDP-2,3-diacylglucosamine diphosphatase [Ramlibacter albus]|uniref:UDP-2,3-diacylglucosamine hydrolase n=1 Tax=Ramlibacter albus TaxID=2079448 RepID=A0A923MCN4_9BURK|nr:UDP-2,3-diacylglucosamine diphosphatase [Ramlibacter albus]